MQIVHIVLETVLALAVEDGADIDEIVVDMDMDFVSQTEGSEVLDWSNINHRVMDDNEKVITCGPPVYNLTIPKAPNTGGDKGPEDEKSEESQEDED